MPRLVGGEKQTERRTIPNAELRTLDSLCSILLDCVRSRGDWCPQRPSHWCRRVERKVAIVSDAEWEWTGADG